ncbi:MAG: glycosyltransferase family 2 protein [Oscillospiraceae bacterium]|nr:glycosyltransferase family 2 protein [Oscillospiraceae bacterium]
MKTLYFVVPCYNEEEALPIAAARISEKLEALRAAGKVSAESGVLYVDDGSKDRTWEMIEALHAADPRVLGVKLSHNRGHQNALLAGLMAVRGRADAAISMDADLQDDIDAADEMWGKFLEGCDIVFGVRSARDTDTAAKRTTAQGYYKLMRSMGADIIYDHADYRLMSARALDALSLYGERDLFLRGIVPELGFKTDVVKYERHARTAGESKYTLKKMLTLASDGVTSMSMKPLRLLFVFGCVIFALACAALLFALIFSLCGGYFPGWGVAAISAWGAAGLVLIGLGVVGEYTGKAYMESKRRPRYIIEKELK